MNRPARRFVLLTAVVATTAGYSASTMAQETSAASSPAATQPADVPVKSVVLFSSGVGYFEHFGNITGDGSTSLNFKTDQINDILKSLVLQDLDGGKVSTITYPSQDPIEKTLASFQINLSDNPSMAELLNRLRGAAVTVSLGANDTINGTILGVETRQRPGANDKGPTNYSVLNVLAGAAIRSIDLDSVRSLDLDDKTLQDELARALSALAQSRGQDKKPVTINFRGTGDRRVRLGYVVSTPIWKTSYRLILSDDKEIKPKLQGWAIVENQTDNDWNDVQLSLVSGRPISFTMNLYQPLYITRPVQELELFASLRPQTYGEATHVGGGVAAAAPMATESAARARYGRQMATAQNFNKDSAAESLGMPAVEPLDASASVQSIASASTVGELFQYTIPNATLGRQKSAMLPIVTDDIEVEKVSIYNPAVLPRNPLNGARVKNTTGKYLLQGPITVLDGNTYAGDAKVNNVPPGQERLISYAVDAKMLIDASKNDQAEQVQSGKIVKGVLEVTRKYQVSRKYESENKSDKDRVLIIEHSFRDGWNLYDTDKPDGKTDKLYRFRRSIAAGKSDTFFVKEENVAMQRVEILPLNVEALAFYQKVGAISPKVRETLRKAAELKIAAQTAQQQAAELTNQLGEVSNGQTRIRENMKTIDKNSQLYNRLMAKLNDEETKIEQLQTKIEDANKNAKDRQSELEKFLWDLNVE